MRRVCGFLAVLLIAAPLAAQALGLAGGTVNLMLRRPAVSAPAA